MVHRIFLIVLGTCLFSSTLFAGETSSNIPAASCAQLFKGKYGRHFSRLNQAWRMFVQEDNFSESDALEFESVVRGFGGAVRIEFESSLIKVNARRDTIEFDLIDGALARFGVPFEVNAIVIQKNAPSSSIVSLAHALFSKRKIKVSELPGIVIEKGSYVSYHKKTGFVPKDSFLQWWEKVLRTKDQSEIKKLLTEKERDIDLESLGYFLKRVPSNLRETQFLYREINILIRKKLKEASPEKIAQFLQMPSLTALELETLEKVSDVSLKKIEDFNPETLSSVFWQMAKIRKDYQSLFVEAVVSKVKMQIKDFSPLDLGNLLRGYYRFGLQDRVFLDLIMKESMNKGDSFDSRSISRFMVAFALGKEFIKRKEKYYYFFKKLIKKTISTLDSLKSKEFVDLTWSIAYMKIQDDEFFKSSLEESKKRISTFNPSELTRLLSAYTYAGYENTSVFQALADECYKRISEFSAKFMVELVWGLRRSGVENRELLETLALKLTPRLKNLKLYEVSNVLFAFSLTSIDYAPFFHEAEKILLEKLHLLKTKDLVKVVQSFSKFKYGKSSFFFKIVDLIIPRLNEVSARVQIELLRSLMKRGYGDKTLLKAVSQSLSSRLKFLDSEYLVDLMWIYRNYGVVEEALFTELVEVLQEREYRFELGSFIRIARSFATLGYFNVSWVKLFLSQFNEQKKIYSDKVWSLYFTLYTYEFEHKDSLPESLQREIKELKNRIEQKRKEKMKLLSEEEISSRSHLQFSEYLSQLGVAHQNEILLEKIFLVDIVFDSFKAIIEVNGIHHYWEDRDGAFYLKGPDLAKYRMLKKQGWVIIELNQFDYIERYGQLGVQGGVDVFRMWFENQLRSLPSR